MSETDTLFDYQLLDGPTDRNLKPSLGQARMVPKKQPEQERMTQYVVFLELEVLLDYAAVSFRLAATRWSGDEVF